MKSKNPALCDHLPATYEDGIYQDESDTSRGAPVASSSRPNQSQYSYDDLPPSYEETPLLTGPRYQSGPKPQLQSEPRMRRRWYTPPPDLPFSSPGRNPIIVQTYFPDYSTDAETLRQMIYDQASYPPTYYMELKGTHTETTYRRQSNGFTMGNNGGRGHNHNEDNNTESQSSTTITDFFIRINMTDLLSAGANVGGELHLLADNQKGFRGGIIKRLHPSVASPDIDNQHEELKAWCDKYVTDPSLKSFTMKREVSNHDTKKLEALLHSAVASTNYRGHVSVSFPITHQAVIVYSPGWINKLRMRWWIRWFFYLTFLWIFSWLYLFLATARYEVVKVVFPYADVSPEDASYGLERTPTVMSETEWFHLWEMSIKRGVFARLNCQASEMDDEYRLTTDRLLESNHIIGQENPFHNLSGGGYGSRHIGIGAFGFNIQFPGQWQQREGWGYDC
ncbi:hypothetical protein HYFRA_00003073 [Hymenoscyphus fraxineus]|uniref:Uncharacterized protein n=1 Tax=Hymenoscyphus fraxineus TaxID=746836 RepID=A0A9N9PL95_9HELO|nr:hypothetical protein HYFRA_00003073 [Hymenoscyphus fraxineus]